MILNDSNNILMERYYAYYYYCFMCHDIGHSQNGIGSTDESIETTPNDAYGVAQRQESISCHHKHHRDSCESHMYEDVDNCINLTIVH